jgi:hypothetical protein
LSGVELIILTVRKARGIGGFASGVSDCPDIVIYSKKKERKIVNKRYNSYSNEYPGHKLITIERKGVAELI